MFTVLLVDDEEMILSTLKSEIPWQEMGVDTVLTAENGQQALELACQQPVALVIADIRMPVMDGLTLVRELKIRSPRTHSILLSAYNEFEYARAAISLGVENYLLKPLIMAEVEQSVRRAIINIYASRNGHWLHYSNTILRWMTGTIEQSELAERSLHHRINLFLPQYAVVCLTKKEQIPLSNFCEKCISALNGQYAVHYCQDEAGCHFMVLGGRHLYSEEIAEKLHQLACENGIEQKVSIAIGNIVTQAADLVQSYLSASRVVELNAAFDGDEVLLSTETPDDEENIQEEDLQLLLYELNTSNASAVIQNFAVQCHEGEKTTLQGYLKACTRLLLLEYPTAEEQVRESLHGLNEELEDVLTQQGFSAALVSLLNTTWQVFDKQFLALSPTVRLALSYIRNEYANGISIRDFCNRCNINPAYLGYLFKRECGVFFNEYLMRVRIAHSIVLLRKPELKINDITVQTGFSSASYFIKCFKALTGMSPAKYRIDRFHIMLNDN